MGYAYSVLKEHAYSVLNDKVFELEKATILHKSQLNLMPKCCKQSGQLRRFSGDNYSLKFIINYRKKNVVF